MQKGQTIENPVTGEQMTFLETTESTRGEYVLVELRAAPGGAVAAAHVHPGQWERFEVVSGRLAAKVGGRRVEARPGEALDVPPGVSHTWWNAGDKELVFRCEVRPALQFESLIETMFSLAADGRTNKKGMPNPFRLAVIAQAHFDTVRLPKIPAWMQKAALAMGAPLGKAMGYGPTYRQEPKHYTPVGALRAAYGSGGGGCNHPRPARDCERMTIADLLHEAAETHHVVYRIVDGDDPDWASWYADWLLGLSELPQLLGSTPVRSHLVHTLVQLDRDYTTASLDERWEDWYAARLAEQFG